LKFRLMFLQAAISMLKQEYKENKTSLNEALKLAIKVLSKTLDTNKLTPERVGVVLYMKDTLYTS